MTTNAILATETSQLMLSRVSKTAPIDVADGLRSDDLRSDDPRWTAVVARDSGRDGEFVFAVSTTGVYCRPSCAARRPRRENVQFFAAPEAAERAGYRACLRCRPKAISGNVETDSVKAICRFIEQHLDEPVTLPSGTRISSELVSSATQIQGGPRDYSARVCR